MKHLHASLLATAVAFTLCATASAAPAQPWADRSKTSGQRTELLLQAMTQEEKLLLVFGYASGDQLAQVDSSVIPGVNTREVMATVIPGSAGYIPGIPRLGIPAQFQADASLGVRNPYLERTSLPSSLATAASWDPRVTEAGGRMIGREARLSGFNVMLAGGVNLAREPQNGRNFEYTGEDPLLAAEMGAGLIRGVQSNHIISTIKHYLINAQ
jgi:beta-glucosidase